VEAGVQTSGYAEHPSRFGYEQQSATIEGCVPDVVIVERSELDIFVVYNTNRPTTFIVCNP